MIGPRISWDRRRELMLEKANARLDADSALDALVGTTVSWLKALAGDAARPGGREILLHAPPVLTSLPDVLRTDGLEEWASRMEALVVAEDPVMDPDQLAAELALGRALGILVADDPDDPTFDLASDIRQRFQGTGGAYWSFAARGLARNPEGSVLLKAMLSRRIDDFTAAPRRSAHLMNRGNTCALVAAYFDEGARLRDVWCNGPHASQMFLRHSSAYGLLLRLDPDSWLGVIERFPAPEPVAQVVRDCRPERDPAVLCSLIRTASSPFAPDGRWRRECKAVFHLLQAAERLLATLAGPVTAGGDPRAFEALLADVQSAFASRSDASALGHAWLEELAWKDYATGEWRAFRDDPAVPNALRRLFVAVGAATPPRDNALEWIEGKDDVWRGDRLLAAVVAMRSRASPADVGAFLTKVLSSDLGGRIERVLSRGETLAAAIIGDAVAGLPDPAAWLDDVWNLSFPLRDRARHPSPRGTAAAEDANLLCVAWGIAGLEQLDQTGPSASGLWQRLAAAIQETLVTIGGWDATGTAALAQARLAKAWPRIFPNAPGPGHPGHLGDFLAPFAAPDARIASKAAVGFPAESIRDRPERFGKSRDFHIEVTDEAGALYPLPTGRTIMPKPSPIPTTLWHRLRQSL